MSIPGQITRAEARALMDLAARTPPGMPIVEIGAFRGRSSAALGFGSQRGHSNRVYAIDAHVEFEGVLGGRFGREDMAHFYHNVTRAGVGSIVAAICLPSTLAARAWPGTPIGMVWIDADHRSEAVRADLEAWSPYVQDVIATAVRDGLLQPAGRVHVLAWFIKRAIHA